MRTLIGLAALGILSIGSVSIGALEADAQDFSLPPTFGVITVTTGFVPDPNWVSVLAGGPNRSEFEDVSTGGPCAGYFASAPDMRVFYQAGDQYPLAFFVDSREDTVLLVNTPDGAWHCNDDTVALNPAIEFDTPLSGQYDIWVGTFSPSTDEFPPATLSITEISAFEQSDFTIAFFGEDDREAIEPVEPPWSQIGFLDLSESSCSGALIGPDIALTSAHCLANDGVIDGTPEAFYAGFSAGSYLASAGIESFHIPDGWLNGEQRGTDFAFLFLDTPIGDELGWMDLGPLSATQISALEAGDGLSILQAGYSYDQQGILTGHIGCPFVGIGDDNEFFHECDTLQGDSGSPLFIETADGPQIVAVESHTRENPDRSAPYNLNVAIYAADVQAELERIGRSQ